MDEDVGVVVVDRCSGRVLNRRLAQWRVDDVKQNNARCVGSKKEEKEASKPITVPTRFWILLKHFTSRSLNSAVYRLMSHYSFTYWKDDDMETHKYSI